MGSISCCRRIPLVAAVFIGLFAHPSPGQAQLPEDAARGALGQRILDTTPPRVLETVYGESRTLTEETAFAPASPGDGDIGIQQIFKRTERWQPFSAFAEMSGYRTSNAFLNDFFRLEDSYLVARAGVGYQRRLGGPFFIDLSLRQQVFRYDKYSILDFESLRAEASLIYILPKMPDTNLFLRYAYERLTDGREHNEFYRNHNVTLGIQRVRPISRGQRLLFGLSAELSLDTVPEVIERNEFALYAGYSVDLTRQLNAGLTYRGAFQDYRLFGREDWNHMIDLTFAFKITRNISCSASLTYSANQSNFGVFDYDATNFGGGLGVLLRF